MPLFALFLPLLKTENQLNQPLSDQKKIKTVNLDLTCFLDRNAGVSPASAMVAAETAAVRHELFEAGGSCSFVLKTAWVAQATG